MKKLKLLLIGFLALNTFVVGSGALRISAVSGQWSNNSSFIYYPDGNVGIGKSTIDDTRFKLQIRGGATEIQKSDLIRLTPGAATNDGSWTMRILQKDRANNDHYPLEIAQPANEYKNCPNCGGDLILSPWRTVVVKATNPASQAKLMVYGKIVAKEVLVTTASTAWPDYVFAEGYKLLDLKEVEAFINKNNHLPGIDSAETIGKEEGVSLGEIQRKQMEKIEELTLYAIQQDKQIDELEARLAKLEALIK